MYLPLHKNFIAIFMEYSKRYYELNKQFNLGKETLLDNGQVSISFYLFKSKDLGMDFQIENPVFSDRIAENTSFIYPVFKPSSMKKANQAILLLHGLNERNWNKYLTWAEELCLKTQKAVVLFPIAYHINRSPQQWSNPRMIQSVYELRRKKNGEDRSLSFANVALSERISENPYRFYSSGRQSMSDITELIALIKSGNHQLFTENSHVDVFAYSIGAFLAQILFLTNPENFFSESKLFMFCGGSIFSSMFGESRTIMDRKAFEILYQYYQEDFNPLAEKLQDKALSSFYSMISPERNEQHRKKFFIDMGNRVAGISLQNDKVIPYSGVEKALGCENAHKRIELLNFDFDYTHENPFPVNDKSKPELVNQAFQQVFTKAVHFLI